MHVCTEDRISSLLPEFQPVTTHRIRIRLRRTFLEESSRSRNRSLMRVEAVAGGRRWDCGGTEVGRVEDRISSSLPLLEESSRIDLRGERVEAVAGGTEVGQWRDGGTGRGALNESPVDATFPQPELWRHSHNQQGL